MADEPQKVLEGIIPEGVTELATHEVARYLGISRSRVGQLREDDKLQARFEPSVLPRGAWLFSRQSVEEYRMQRQCNPLAVGATRYAQGAEAHEGVVAAKAFALFDEHKSVTEVVKILHVKPKRIRELWAEYKTPLGQRVMTPETERELFEREATIADLRIREDKARALLLAASRPHLGGLNGKVKP